jgi:hypothetical protein
MSGHVLRHHARCFFAAQTIINGPSTKRQLVIVAPVSGGEFNRSTQHSSLLIWHVETVCI